MKIIKAKELKKGDRFELFKLEKAGNVYTYLDEYKRSLFYIYIVEQVESGRCIANGIMKLRKKQKVRLINNTVRKDEYIYV